MTRLLTTTSRLRMDFFVRQDGTKNVMGFGFLNGFCSNSSKDSKFVVEALSVVGAVDTRTRQLGGREHRCMSPDRRRVLCSATVHCDETTASSVSPSCCRASADRARLCWSHRVGDDGSGTWGCGWKYGIHDYGRHWGGRVELRGQCNSAVLVGVRSTWTNVA
jgi:hypothetical protein